MCVSCVCARWAVPAVPSSTLHVHLESGGSGFYRRPLSCVLAAALRFLDKSADPPWVGMGWFPVPTLSVMGPPGAWVDRRARGCAGKWRQSPSWLAAKTWSRAKPQSPDLLP